MSDKWPPDFFDMSTDENGFGEPFVAQFMRRQIAIKGKISHELYEYLKEAPDDILVEVLVGTQLAAAAGRKYNTRELFHAIGSIAFDHLVSRDRSNEGALRRLRKKLNPIAKLVNTEIEKEFGEEDDQTGSTGGARQLEGPSAQAGEEREDHEEDPGGSPEGAG